MYSPNLTTQFKKDYKRMMKRGKEKVAFETAFDILLSTGKLPPK